MVGRMVLWWVAMGAWVAHCNQAYQEKETLRLMKPMREGKLNINPAIAIKKPQGRIP